MRTIDVVVLIVILAIMVFCTRELDSRKDQEFQGEVRIIQEAK